MSLRAVVLASAGLGVGAIGLIYLAKPDLLLDVYGMEIQSTSEANILRSGSGGLFLALAILFGLGALDARFTRTSLVTLLTFMTGLAVGRVVSIATDGWPHPVLVVVMLVETLYARLAGYLVRDRRAAESSRGKGHPEPSGRRSSRSTTCRW